MNRVPDFYTGAPVDPVDLRFRGAFLEELWQTLRTQHAVLTAPRRTGKTSIMDHLHDRPEHGFSVVSINVQDLTHPAEFFQALLDAFHDAHPDFLRGQLAKGWELLSGVLRKVDEIDVGGFKLALRRSDPEWDKNWRQHGDRLLAQARKTGRPVLFIVDEFPDMLLNLARENEPLLRGFLAWFRAQRLSPAPARDPVRWLVGGSVNLSGTLDSLGLVDLINDLVDIPLPPLTDEDVEAFLNDMLGGRGVPFDNGVGLRLVARLGRPIPLFMQMATQDLYRLWKREQRKIVASDVDTVFDAMIVSSGARPQLQHFHSRIRQYYGNTNGSIAHALLGQISASEEGLGRTILLQETERLLADLGLELPPHERRQVFNRIMLDLENDFYVEEVKAGVYNFAGGVLKLWWRKYHA
ncbi:MAG: AAA family ATPase [Gammaproteobacteria bacterium]|nr:AAA family ATPase [Gammaproteobacteria bacterium]MDE0367714.1 AAA family ATPase [Gammaproteobacteria bacterium]